MWQLLDTGINSATTNMELDAKLLEELDPMGPAILHLYRWKEPSATYGYFIDTDRFLNQEGVKKRGLALARRPTGGGIVFHVSDLAFSVLVPSQHEGFSENTLDNYRYVNEKVVCAVQALLQEGAMTLLPLDPRAIDPSCNHFCMAKPTIFDVMMDGKKIAGAAQRKRKQGFLHQGSISIAMPQLSFLQEVLLPDTKVLEAMQMHTHTLLSGEWSEQQLEEMRHQLRQHLKKVFLES